MEYRRAPYTVQFNWTWRGLHLGLSLTGGWVRFQLGRGTGWPVLPKCKCNPRTFRGPCEKFRLRNLKVNVKPFPLMERTYDSSSRREVVVIDSSSACLGVPVILLSLCPTRGARTGDLTVVVFIPVSTHLLRTPFHPHFLPGGSSHYPSGKAVE